MSSLLKRSLRYFLISLLALLTFIAVYSLYFHFLKQDKKPVYHPNYIIKSYQQQDWQPKYDSLLEVWGNNKTLPLGYELQALLALSHYPELKDKRVVFIQEETFIPLASRPNLLTLWTGGAGWEYQVVISTKSKDFMEPILLKNLSFNSQIGVLGHELAHTLYYQDKNAMDILAIGAGYIFPKFRAKFEKATDKRAILHGLGWQLLHYAQEVRSEAKGFPKEVIVKEVDSYYMNPQEIREYLTQVPGY